MWGLKFKVNTSADFLGSFCNDTIKAYILAECKNSGANDFLIHNVSFFFYFYIALRFAVFRQLEYVKISGFHNFCMGICACKADFWSLEIFLFDYWI